MTTIAWRCQHNAVDCLDSYSTRAFGGSGTGLTGMQWVAAVSARERAPPVLYMLVLPFRCWRANHVVDPVSVQYAGRGRSGSRNHPERAPARPNHTTGRDRDAVSRFEICMSWSFLRRPP